MILVGTAEAHAELREEVRQHVSRKVGPTARPKAVFIVPRLPQTRSGKIMRRLQRDVADGRDLGDTTTPAELAWTDERPALAEGECNRDQPLSCP